MLGLVVEHLMSRDELMLGDVNKQLLLKETFNLTRLELIKFLFKSNLSESLLFWRSKWHP